MQNTALQNTVSQWSTVLAGLLPFLLVVATMPAYIHFLKKRYLGQYVRDDGPQSHLSKKGTPTAGGVPILVAVVLCSLLLLFLQNNGSIAPSVYWVLAVTVILGAAGFMDDYLKIAKKNHKGLSGYGKLAVQSILGFLLGVGMLTSDSASFSGDVRFFNGNTISLGWGYPFFSALVMTATSNAVNLTDGLDGLASGTALLSFMTLSLLLFASNQPELALLAQCFVGALLGFLLFNRYPARIFMGDTGSLAIGGALAAIAILSGYAFWLILIGLVFVLEALSVILQVASFKLTGKRIFKMSPLHHHFELSGWKEPQVMYAFVTFQFFCCILAIFLQP
ncbi:MAG: phospho-N-acetylmuramoyl-pentapeptide-transferase [Cyanobacteria bacterium P01_H01_bin.74]